MASNGPLPLPVVCSSAATTLGKRQGKCFEDIHVGGQRTARQANLPGTLYSSDELTYYPEPRAPASSSCYQSSLHHSFHPTRNYCAKLERHSSLFLANILLTKHPKTPRKTRKHQETLNRTTLSCCYSYVPGVLSCSGITSLS